MCAVTASQWSSIHKRQNPGSHHNKPRGPGRKRRESDGVDSGAEMTTNIQTYRQYDIGRAVHDAALPDERGDEWQHMGGSALGVPMEYVVRGVWKPVSIARNIRRGGGVTTSEDAAGVKKRLVN